jgi:hypothetical protein
MKPIINENEIKHILSMHRHLKEQTGPTPRGGKLTPEKLDKTQTELKNGEYTEQAPRGGGSSGTSALPAWTNDYPCLKDKGEIKKTTDDTQVYYDGKPEKDFNFYFNNNLTVVIYWHDVKKFDGTWKCVNGKLLIKTPSDNQEWTKEKGWYVVPKQNVSKYTKCDEKLPIKQWCKNETIKRVQACLKMPTRYQTGNFGQNTQEYLESKGQNGKTITTETIINVCGPNDPLVTGSSGTSGTSGTGASGTSGTGASGTSGTGASGTPTVVTKTGYENYRKIRIPEE